MEASYTFPKEEEEEEEEEGGGREGEDCLEGQDSCLLPNKCPHEWSFLFLTFALDLTGALLLFADISVAFLKILWLHF